MLNEESRKLKFGEQFGLFIKSSPARATFIIAILVLLLTYALNPGMNVLSTFSSVLILTILLSIASAGQTIVLVGGGLDFSVGAVMSSTAILTTYVMNGQEGHFLEVFALAMGIGLLVGALNGLVCTRINLPPMILTMAVSNVVTRLQYVFTSGRPGGYAAESFTNTIFYPIFGVIPAAVMYAIIIWSLVFYLLYRSTFGRQLFLVGANPNAARLNGINVNRVKFMSYVISGVLCAFAGMLGAAQQRTARCQIFDKYAFDSLIAVIVGGTAFTGGVGTYAGSIAGSLLMVSLNTILTMLPLTSQSQDLQNVVRGVVMILLLIIYNRQKAVRQ